MIHDIEDSVKAWQDQGAKVVIVILPLGFVSAEITYEEKKAHVSGGSFLAVVDMIDHLLQEKAEE
jgi:hypothetical protein